MFTTSLPLAFLLIAEVSDAPDGGFDDLGYLLFGGLIAAIVVAIVVAFLKLKRQDKQSASTDFISINPSRHEDRN